MSNNNKKKTVDDYLNEVSYSDLHDPSKYTPSKFALKFMNFIKLVNGKEGESHKTPVMHLAMLDKLASKKYKKIANLAARGTSKTTLFAEYLVLYVAIFGELPNFGNVSGILYISDSMENGVKSVRNSIEFRYNNSEFLQEWIPKARFTQNYLEFTNKAGKSIGVKMFGATSGIRGTKIFNKRPVLAIMDDLVSDSDANSPTTMETIKNTVYSGVQYALDPTHYKMILNGTPFNKHDIVYEAIESGAWEVNVWPICEKFPCSRKDFRGCWEDRFTYDYVNEQYESAKKEGNLKSFRQELMLRITSDEDKLVQDSEIQWYSRKDLLQNKYKYNFYITTDFATSSKQTADYTVISVWAYGHDGSWYWVDGICERQTMDITINDLFRLAEQYEPQSVGIEITGQQGGFISWIQREMNHRDIYFNLARSSQNVIGIRPITDKLSRFNLVVPLFKMGKMNFPEELKDSKIMGICTEQISLTTRDGIKGKDDFIDTISMLQYLNAWRPVEDTIDDPEVKDIESNQNVFGDLSITNRKDDDSELSKYIV